MENYYNVYPVYIHIVKFFLRASGSFSTEALRDTVFLRLREAFSTAPGAFLRLREVFLRLRELFYGSGSFSTAPGAFLRLREVFLRLRELFYGSGKFFYGSGSFSTAPGAFLRLREVFLRLRELFYGSGSFSTAPGAFLRLRELFYGSGSFSTAPGSFSTAPGAFLRLRELFYGSGSFSTAPGSFSTAPGSLFYGSGQAARRACLLPRSSTNSSKNNLTVWAAVAGGGGGYTGLYSPRHQIRANRSALRTTWMSNGVLVAYFTVCHLYSDSVWTAHTRTSTWERSHIFAFQSAFPCPLQIFGQNELRCEPRECSIVLTMCISPHPTSSPTRIRPKLSLFEHRALQRQSAPQIGLRVRAKRGALRNTRLFYSSA